MIPCRLAPVRVTAGWPRGPDATGLSAMWQARRGGPHTPVSGPDRRPFSQRAMRPAPAPNPLSAPRWLPWMTPGPHPTRPYLRDEGWEPLHTRPQSKMPRSSLLARSTRHRRPPLAPPRQTPASGPYHHHLSSPICTAPRNHHVPFVTLPAPQLRRSRSSSGRRRIAPPSPPH
jgi:hypothetical protein